MSVDFSATPKGEVTTNPSDTPLFAATPVWERSRKRRAASRPARVAADTAAADAATAQERVTPRRESPATAESFDDRAGDRRSGVAPVAIAAGVIVLAGLGAA